MLEAYQQGAKVLKSLNEVLLPAAEEAVNELDEVTLYTKNESVSLLTNIRSEKHLKRLNWS